MAEPALAVVVGPSGPSECYRSQWGGHSSHLEAVFDHPARDPFEVLFACAWEHHSHGDDLVTALDYLRFETLYVLTPSGVAVFVPLWFGIPPSLELPPQVGAVVRVDSLAEVQRLRRRIRRTKAICHERLAASDWSPELAVARLWSTLQRRTLIASQPLRELIASTAGTRW